MRKLLGAAVASVVLLITPPIPASAAESVEAKVTEVGWWSVNPASFQQSEEGFEVAADPSGQPQSVAALRVLIAATSVETLQVRFDEAGSVGTEFGTLQLCVTTSSWTAAKPGSLDEAPTPDCTISAGLTRTLEGSWLGDAAALAPNGGEVSLMVLPNYQPPNAVGPPLVVSISGGDVAATGSTSPVSTGADTEQDDAVTTVSGGSTDYFGPPDGGSFGIPGYIAEPDFGSLTPDPPLDEDDVVPRPDGSDQPLALAPLDTDGDSEPGAPWTRLVILVPLSAGIGVGAARLRRALGEGLFSHT